MYNVQDIVFEVGRKCNLRCPHCLRGCSQDIAIKDKYIDQVLSEVESIGTLTLTGGEPFLYPEKIKYIVDKIVERNIAVGNFFVATNGLVRSMDVVTSLLRLYEICDEKEICELKISADEFHGNYGDTWEVLNALGFSYIDDSLTEKNLLAEGYAVENGYDVTRKPEENDFELNEDNVSGMIYVSAIGNILKGCNFSYDSQSYYAYGNLDDSNFVSIIEGMA